MFFSLFFLISWFCRPRRPFPCRRGKTHFWKAAYLHESNSRCDISFASAIIFVKIYFFTLYYFVVGCFTRFSWRPFNRQVRNQFVKGPKGRARLFLFINTLPLSLSVYTVHDWMCVCVSMLTERCWMALERRFWFWREDGRNVTPKWRSSRQISWPRSLSP